ncbi:hypothetical protein E9993_11720 [Labilibacter sediminis]|nr:hypothetical protein E9993_11720 [Labilibacter sediminis]
MKNLIFIILFVAFGGQLMGQSKEGNELICRTIVPPIKLSISKKEYTRLKQWLRINGMCIDMLCNPIVQSCDYCNFKCDSTSQVELLERYTTIAVECSYSWNIDEYLPVVPKTKVIKALLKSKAKKTDEEWKILKYMEFYSGDYCEQVSSFVHNQKVKINGKRIFLVKYIFEFNEECKLTLVDKSIKKL